MANKVQIWGKSASWRPQKMVYPSSVDELQEVLVATRKADSKLRVAGSLHSMNTLAATSGTQVFLDHLSKIQEIASNRVKVQAGIKIKDLVKILAQHNLALPNQGYITEQTIAGAIATATHGSGSTGTLSSFVQELELIDAFGTLHSLSPERDAHLFSAAVTHLGCLGIVSSITLKCIPAQKLRLTRTKGLLAPTLNQLPELLNRYPYFQIYLDPYSDRVLTWCLEPTHDAPKKRWEYGAKWMIIKSLATASMDFMPNPSWWVPQIFKIFRILSPIQDCVDEGYKILSPADEGHYIEQEIALPFEKLESALFAARTVINTFKNQGNCCIILQLIRFAEPDPYGYLSPAHNRKTAYISHITINKKGYLEIFQEVEKALYQFGGRPHWGKVNFLTQERALDLYGNNLTLFQQVRRQLDPEGIFSNAYCDKLNI